jgi:hypothetical protein
MRAWLLVGVIVVAPAAAFAARLEIRGAAARVVIIPEPRADIQVIMVRSRASLPLRISRSGQTTFIDGGLGHRIHGCTLVAGQTGVRIRGLDTVAAADLPRLVVRAPLAVKVAVGDGVSGAVGRADSLELDNRGCGRWTIANVRGRLTLNQIGAGEARVGQAGAANLNVAGGGAIATQAIHGPLTAVSSGAGAIQADSASGPVLVRIAGSGSVGVRTGVATQLNISIAGSGVARFGGEARSLSAYVAGPGYVSVGKVTGPVSRHVFGAGEIHIGR